MESILFLAVALVVLVFWNLWGPKGTYGHAFRGLVSVFVLMIMLGPVVNLMRNGQMVWTWLYVVHVSVAVGFAASLIRVVWLGMRTWQGGIFYRKKHRFWARTAFVFLFFVFLTTYLARLDREFRLKESGNQPSSPTKPQGRAVSVFILKSFSF